MGPPAQRRARPRGLLLATVATAVEGVALIAFGAWLGWESVAARASNEQVAQGSAVYFLLVGLLVLLLAWALWRRRTWALGAALALQLLAVAVAVTMGQGGFLLGAVPLAAMAVAAVAGLLQPGSRAALGRR